MTSWIWAIDPRFTMAAPSCFITTFEKNLENEIPADAEQYPPGVLGAGLEMADVLTATNFPKPLLLCGQRYCFFDRRGLEEAHADLKQLYSLAGKADDVDLFIGANDHGFHADAQQAVAEFFCKHAGLPPPPPTEEGAFVPLPTESLEACGGQVVGFRDDVVPVHETLGAVGRALAASRSSLPHPQLVDTARSLLDLPESLPRDTPAYRVLRTGKQVDPPVISGKSTELPDHTIARYAVQTEPGMEAFLHKPVSTGFTQSLDIDDDGSVATQLHVPDLLANEELGDASVLDWLGWGDGGRAAAASGSCLYVVEPRGLGESWPEGPAGALTTGAAGAAGSGFTDDARHPRWASCALPPGSPSANQSVARRYA